MYLYVERIRDFFGLCAIQIYFLLTFTYLKLNGVPLEKFEPYPFVRSWLATGNRLSTSWVPVKRNWQLLRAVGSL